MRAPAGGHSASSRFLTERPVDPPGIEPGSAKRSNRRRSHACPRYVRLASETVAPGGRRLHHPARFRQPRAGKLWLASPCADAAGLLGQLAQRRPMPLPAVRRLRWYSQLGLLVWSKRTERRSHARRPVDSTSKPIGPKIKRSGSHPGLTLLPAERVCVTSHIQGSALESAGGAFFIPRRPGASRPNRTDLLSVSPSTGRPKCRPCGNREASPDSSRNGFIREASFVAVRRLCASVSLGARAIFGVRARVEVSEQDDAHTELPRQRAAQATPRAL